MADTQKSLDEFLKHSIVTGGRTKSSTEEGRLYLSKDTEKQRIGYLRLPKNIVNANLKSISIMLVETRNPEIDNGVYIMLNCEKDNNRIDLSGNNKGTINKSKIAMKIIDHLKLTSKDTVSKQFTLTFDKQKTDNFAYTTYRLTLK